MKNKIDLIVTINNETKIYKIYVNSRQVFKSEDKTLFEQAKKIYVKEK